MAARPQMCRGCLGIGSRYSVIKGYVPQGSNLLIMAENSLRYGFLLKNNFGDMQRMFVNRFTSLNYIRFSSSGLKPAYYCGELYEVWVFTQEQFRIGIHKLAWFSKTVNWIL